MNIYAISFEAPTGQLQSTEARSNHKAQGLHKLAKHVAKQNASLFVAEEGNPNIAWVATDIEIPEATLTALLDTPFHTRAYSQDPRSYTWKLVTSS